MANLMDFAEAYRRRRMIPARPSPAFTTRGEQVPGLEEISEFSAPAAPMTSTGRGTFAPAMPTPPAPRRTNVRAALGSALTGASAAMAAPVTTVPGQEFRQALVRGIMGASAAFGAERTRQDTADARAAALAARMAELGMKAPARTPEQEAEAARLKAEATLPTRLKLLEAQNQAISGRMEKMKTEAVNKAKGLDEARWRAAAWDDAMAWAKEKFRSDFTMPSDAEMSIRAENAYKWISKGKAPASNYDYLRPPQK